MTPTAMRSDGTCPTCGRVLGDAEQPAQEVVVDDGAPWHFKLLVGAVAVYLGWRLIEMIGWLF
jgi:hypothetical protein